jgi:hypothetical protein
VPSRIQQIVDGIEAVIVANTTGYQKSKYSFDLTQNNLRTSKKVYAVRPKAASPTSSAIKAWTLDQEFEIVLSDEFVNKDKSDSATSTALYGLYTDLEEIGKKILITKLGLSNFVLAVQTMDISEPDIDNDNNIVTITSTVVIKFKNGDIT